MSKNNIGMKIQSLSKRAAARQIARPAIKTTSDAKIENENFSMLKDYIYKEVHPVATSSITKQFVAKDSKAFEKLLKEADKMPERTAAVRENSSLDRGRKALKQFSLQSS